MILGESKLTKSNGQTIILTFKNSKKLGTSSSQTICTAGCAMSSVAMALASYSEKISGDLVNPGNLNNWLNNHNGYADTDLIVWSC